MVFQGPAMSFVLAQAPAVQPDGRTATTAIQNPTGGFDVRTNTVNGINAYNSFNRFNVNQGTTTNLFVPDAARNLVNLVHHERSQIDGILNSYRNGQIGGNVYFLNPHGIVIGQSGTVNVGSLNLQTPTQEYMRNLLSETGSISAVHERMIFDGTVPISPSGLISVKGKVNAVESVELRAGNIDVGPTGRIQAGRQVQVEFSDLVNAQGLNWGNDLTVSPEGKIRIVASKDVNVAGEIAAKEPATSSQQAGDIEIRAGNDIHVQSGAKIDATSGRGDGGNVVVFADRNATIENGALIDVSSVSGKGGFLEFSAKETVDITGDVLHSSAGGKILIDPTNISWKAGIDDDVYKPGTDYELTATNSITLDGIYISTRTVNDVGLTGAAKRQAHLNNASIGKSGNITLEAPNITLIDSALLAHATGSYTGGDVTIRWTGNDSQFTEIMNKFGGGGSDINIRGSTLKGENIVIKVVMSWGGAIDESDLINPDGAAFQLVIDTGEVILKDVLNAVTKNLLDYIPITVQVLKSKISIEDSKLIADKSIDISADLKSTASIKTVGTAAFMAGFAFNMLDSDISITGGSELIVSDPDTKSSNANAISVTSDIAQSVKIASGGEKLQIGEGGGENFAVLDAGLAVVLGTNRITVDGTSILDAGVGNILIEATSERKTGINMKTSDTPTLLASLGIMFGETKTEVEVLGTLIGKNIKVHADADITGDMSVFAGMVLQKKDEEPNPPPAEPEPGQEPPEDTPEQSRTKAFFADNDNRVKMIDLFTNIVVDVVDVLSGKDISGYVTPIANVGKGIMKTVSSTSSSTENNSNPAPAQDANPNSQANKTVFNVALGVAVDQIVTKATVGGNVTATGDVAIEALTKVNPGNVAIAEIQPKGGDASGLTQVQNAFALSLPVILSMTETQAIVKDKAVLDLAGDLSVHATYDHPYQIGANPLATLIENLVDNATDKDKKFDGEQFTQNLLDTVSGFGSNFNLTGMFMSWGEATTLVEELGLGATVNVTYEKAKTIARIGDGVNIKNAAAVDVVADSVIHNGYITGTIQTFFPDLTQLSLTDPSSVTKIGQQLSNLGTGSRSGVGVGVLVAAVENYTKAEIGSATIKAESVNVDADSDVFSLLLSAGGGRTEGFGMSGSLDFQYYDSYTLARIDDEAKITVSKDVDIVADDNMLALGFGGNVSVGSGSVFGLTGVVGVTVREAHAVWGELNDKETPTAVVVSTVGGDVNIHATLSGLIVQVALAGAAKTNSMPESTSGSFGTSVFDPIGGGIDTSNDSLANDGREDRREDVSGAQGSLLGNSDSGTNSNMDVNSVATGAVTDIGGTSSQAGGGSGGLGLSGAVVGSVLVEDTSAGIRGNIYVTAKNFDIAAINEAIDIGVGGGVTANLSTNSSDSIAGAIGANLLFGDTVAFVDTAAPKTLAAPNGGTLAFTNEFNINAERGGYIGAFSGGIGVSLGGGTTVAGAISVTSIIGGSKVDIRNTTLDSKAGSVTADALNRALIVNVAGGLAVGKGNSVGASLAVSNISLDTQTEISSATVDVGNLTLQSRTESLIVTVALAGGVAVGSGVAAGLTLAVNLSEGDTLVRIDDSKITLTGDLITLALSDTFKGTDGTYAAVQGELKKAENEQDDPDSDDKDAKRSAYTDEKGETIEIAKTNDSTKDNTGDRDTKKETKQVQLGLAAESPRVITAALAVGVSSSSAAFAANLGVNISSEETAVEIVNNSTINARNATIGANTETGMIAVGLGISAGSSLALSGNLGVNLVGGRTEAHVRNSTVTATNDLKIEAASRGGIINAASTIAISGSSAGVGLGFSYNMFAHSIAVDIEDATLTGGRNLTLDAENGSALIGILLSVGGGSTAGGAVALSINTIGQIDLDDVEESSDDAKDTFDEQKDKLGADILAFANRTEIRMSDSVLEATRGDLTMDADSTGRMLAISAAVGVGGTAGAGVGGSYNSVSGSVGIFGNNVDLNAGKNIHGTSDIDNGMISVVVGAGGGGTAGIGVSVGANVMKSANRVRFGVSNTQNRNKYDVTAGENIVFQANNSGEIIGTSTALAVGGVVAAAVGVGVNVLIGETEIDLGGYADDKINYLGQKLTAGDSIVLDAGVDNDIYGITASIAIMAGGGGGALGGLVSVNILESQARINLQNAALSAAGNILAHSTVDSKLLAVSGNAAAAISPAGAAITLSMAYNEIASTNSVDVVSSTMEAGATKASGFDSLVKSYGLKGDFSTFKDRKGVGIGAYTNSDLENYFFAVAATGVGAAVNIGVPVNKIGGKTSVTLDGSHVYRRGAGYTNDSDVVIEALAASDSFGVVGSLAVSGGASVGAMVDLHLLESNVTTTIKNTPMNVIGDAIIAARNDDTTQTYLISAAFGGLAAPLNAEGVVAKSVVKTVLDADSNRSVNAGYGNSVGGSIDIIADNELNTKEFLFAGAAGIAAVGVSFGINTLEQKTSIEINNYDLWLYGKGDINILATGTNIFEGDLSALAGGLAGIGGALSTIIAEGTTSISFFGDEVDMRAQNGNVTIKAVDEFIQKDSFVGGVGVGVVGGAAGLSVLVLRNGAFIDGYADITALNPNNNLQAGRITIDARVKRDVNNITLAGAAGLVGLAAAVNVVDIGAVTVDGDSRKNVEETANYSGFDKVSEKIDESDMGETAARAGGALSEIQRGKSKIGGSMPSAVSAAVNFNGTLVSGLDITIGADANNSINTNSAAVAGGVVGAGGAMGYTNIKDVISATYYGNATAAKDFVLQGTSHNSGEMLMVAGAAGLAGLAGSLNIIKYDSDIAVLLGTMNNSLAKNEVLADSISVLADQNFEDFDIWTGAVAVGAVGIGGSLATVTLTGDVVAQVQHALLYAPSISLEARKDYTNIDIQTVGIAGGLIGGGGVDSTLDMKGKAEVLVARGAQFSASKTGRNPIDGDEIEINARVEGNNVHNTGKVFTAGLATTAFGDTATNLNFDTSIRIGSANLKSHDIDLQAYRVFEDVSSQQQTDTIGLICPAGGISEIVMRGVNTISLENNSVLEAWGALNALAGRGKQNAVAETRVFIGGVSPSRDVKAVTDIDVDNVITLAGTKLYAVRDIVLKTGDENYDVASAYASKRYLIPSGEGFTDTDEVSAKEATGTLRNTSGNTINLNGNNTLEAGIHWDASVTINKNGTVTKPDWLIFDVAQGESKSIYDLMTSQIEAVKAKKSMATTIKEKDAFDLEIKFLEDELKYYMRPGATDPTLRNSYYEVATLVVKDSITVGSGDVFMYGNVNATGSNNTLTAHGDIRIVLQNNSDKYLQLGDDTTMTTFTAVDPRDGGGRILINGAPVDTLAHATIHSFDTGTNPLIKIANDRVQVAGTNFYTELFLNNAVLVNRAGLVDISSSGSIWNAAEIDALDVYITTAGSYYQEYADGRTDIGGNPYNATNVRTAIQNWMKGTLLYGGSFTAGTQSFPTWYVTSYEEYVSAMNTLQSICSTESWAKVFGENGTRNTGDLRLKSGEKITSSNGGTQLNAYNKTKGEYEWASRMVAERFLGSKVKKFSDIRSTAPKWSDYRHATIVKNGAGRTIKSIRNSYSNEVNKFNGGWKNILDGSGVLQETAKYSMLQSNLPNNTGTIYALRSVFISAETLNINGTIESGISGYNIDLTKITDPQKQGRQTHAYTWDLTEAVFGSTLIDIKGEKITMPTIRYHSATDRYIIDDLQVYGGNITLSGNIISTGNGQLRVADGYGDITISAGGNQNVEIGRIDTGLSPEGRITIHDTAKSTQGRTYVYTRENGVVRVACTDGAAGNTWSGTWDGYYTPVADRWLKNVTEIETILQVNYTYTSGYQSSGGGSSGGTTWVDVFAKDSNDITGLSASASVNKFNTVGTYLVNWSPPSGVAQNGVLYGSFQRTAESPIETFKNRYTNEKKSLFGTIYNHYFHFDFTYTQQVNETYATYLNASQKIGIQFLGNDTKSGSINLTGANTFTLTDLLRAGGDNGSVSIKAGTIANSGGLINAARVSLAGSMANAMQIEAPHNGTRLNLNSYGGIGNTTSQGGSAVVNVIGGPITLESVQNIRNLTVDSNGSILTDKNDHLNVNNQLTLNSRYGEVDVYMNVGDNIIITAAGDIRLNSNSGNLHIDRIISTGGDVQITSLTGRILDANFEETPDPLSDWAQAQYVWEAMGLIAGTKEYTAKSDAALAGYNKEMTARYNEAWAKAGYDSAYDADFQFGYSIEERDTFLAAGMTDEQIRQKETDLTFAYHLNGAKGYDNLFSYDSGKTASQLGMKGWNEDQLKNSVFIPDFLLTGDAGIRNNTTSVIEQPNISGHNVTLSAYRGIGEQQGEVTVGTSLKQLMNDTVRQQALYDAEIEDVTKNADGTYTIKQYNDLDIRASGVLNVATISGPAYLGAQSDVTVGTIQVGLDQRTLSTLNDLRFKIDGSIFGVHRNSVSSPHIVARNIVLEAAGGTLGTGDNPLIIQNTDYNNQAYQITARGTEGVNLGFYREGNLASTYVREITSLGEIYLKATELFDATPGDTNILISGRNLILDVVTVGSASNPFEIAVDILTLPAKGVRYVTEKATNVNAFDDGNILVNRLYTDTSGDYLSIGEVKNLVIRGDGTTLLSQAFDDTIHFTLTGTLTLDNMIVDAVFRQTSLTGDVILSNLIIRDLLELETTADIQAYSILFEGGELDLTGRKISLSGFGETEAGLTLTDSLRASALQNLNVDDLRFDSLSELTLQSNGSMRVTNSAFGSSKSGTALISIMGDSTRIDTTVFSGGDISLDGGSGKLNLASVRIVGAEAVDLNSLSFVQINQVSIDAVQITAEAKEIQMIDSSLSALDMVHLFAPTIYVQSATDQKMDHWVAHEAGIFQAVVYGNLDITATDFYSKEVTLFVFGDHMSLSGTSFMDDNVTVTLLSVNDMNIDMEGQIFYTGNNFSIVTGRDLTIANAGIEGVLSGTVMRNLTLTGITSAGAGYEINYVVGNDVLLKDFDLGHFSGSLLVDAGGTLTATDVKVTQATVSLSATGSVLLSGTTIYSAPSLDIQSRTGNVTLYDTVLNEADITAAVDIIIDRKDNYVYGKDYGVMSAGNSIIIQNAKVNDHFSGLTFKTDSYLIVKDVTLENDAIVDIAANGVVLENVKSESGTLASPLSIVNTGNRVLKIKNSSWLVGGDAVLSSNESIEIDGLTLKAHAIELTTVGNLTVADGKFIGNSVNLNSRRDIIASDLDLDEVTGGILFTAGGSILHGRLSGGDLVLGPQTEYSAGKTIALVVDDGNLLSTGTPVLRASEIILASMAGDIDMEAEMTGLVHLFGRDIDVTNTSAERFTIGKMWSKNEAVVNGNDVTSEDAFSAAGSPEIQVNDDFVDAIVTGRENTLAGVLRSENRSNHRLLGYVVSFAFDELHIVNTAQGGTANIGLLDIVGGTQVVVKADNLNLGSVGASAGTSFSHLGYTNDVARSTVIGQVLSDSFKMVDTVSESIAVNDAKGIVLENVAGSEVRIVAETITGNLDADSFTAEAASGNLSLVDLNVTADSIDLNASYGNVNLIGGTYAATDSLSITAGYHVALNNTDLTGVANELLVEAGSLAMSDVVVGGSRVFLQTAGDIILDGITSHADLFQAHAGGYLSLFDFMHGKSIELESGKGMSLAAITAERLAVVSGQDLYATETIEVVGQLQIRSGGSLELVDAAVGTASIQAANDIELGLLAASGGSVRMVSTTGAILDANGDDLNIDAPNADLILDAAGGIGPGDALEIIAKTMRLYSTDGDILIHSKSAFTTLNDVVAPVGDVIIDTDGQLLANIDIITNGEVRLTSARDMKIMGITSNNAILFAGNNLTVEGDLKGDLYTIQSGNDINFDHIVTDLDSLRVDSGGTMNIGGSKLTVNDDISLVSVGDIIFEGGNVAAGKLSISAQGSIGITSVDLGQVVDPISAFAGTNLTFDGGGAILDGRNLSAVENLSITNAEIVNGLAINVTGNVVLTNINFSGEQINLTAGDSVQLDRIDVDGSTFRVESQNDIGLGYVYSSGEQIIIVSNFGAIFDTNDNASNIDASGTKVTLRAGGDVGVTGNALEISSASLSMRSEGGNILVHVQNETTVLESIVTDAGGIGIIADGTLVVGTDMVANGAVRLIVAEDVVLAAGVLVHAGDIDIAANGWITTETNVVLNAAANLNVTSMESDENLTLNAGQDIHITSLKGVDATIVAGNNTTVHEALDVTQLTVLSGNDTNIASLASNRALVVAGNDATLTGLVDGGDIRIESGGKTLLAGVVGEFDGLEILSGGETNISDSHLRAKHEILLTSGDAQNVTNTVLSGENIVLSSGADQSLSQVNAESTGIIELTSQGGQRIVGSVFKADNLITISNDNQTISDTDIYTDEVSLYTAADLTLVNLDGSVGIAIVAAERNARIDAPTTTNLFGGSEQTAISGATVVIPAGTGENITINGDTRYGSVGGSQDIVTVAVMEQLHLQNRTYHMKTLHGQAEGELGSRDAGIVIDGHWLPAGLFQHWHEGIRPAIVPIRLEEEEEEESTGQGDPDRNTNDHLLSQLKVDRSHE